MSHFFGAYCIPIQGELSGKIKLNANHNQTTCKFVLVAL